MDAMLDSAAEDFSCHHSRALQGQTDALLLILHIALPGRSKLVELNFKMKENVVLCSQSSMQFIKNRCGQIMVLRLL
jgi:hypothetical protein